MPCQKREVFWEWVGLETSLWAEREMNISCLPSHFPSELPRRDQTCWTIFTGKMFVFIYYALRAKGIAEGYQGTIKG